MLIKTSYDYKLISLQGKLIFKKFS